MRITPASDLAASQVAEDALAERIGADGLAALRETLDKVGR